MQHFVVEARRTSLLVRNPALLGYSAAWLGYYEPPTVYQRDIYISETSLYDPVKNQLVWSGTVETIDPSDINKEIKRYVDTVIQGLKKQKSAAAQVTLTLAASSNPGCEENKVVRLASVA